MLTLREEGRETKSVFVCQQSKRQKERVRGLVYLQIESYLYLLDLDHRDDLLLLLYLVSLGSLHKKIIEKMFKCTDILTIIEFLCFVCWN